MVVSRHAWSFGLIWVIGSLGCAHLLETKTIEKFAANLEKQDLEGLKENSSQEFAERALRTADAIDDLKILRIPDGKISVVKVEDLSKTHKRVTVEIGEAKKEVFYELTKNSSGRWVVDDIYLRQKKQGVEAYKAVSEQMDLLITVREFLDACDTGDRSDVLGGVTPKLRKALETLPPAHLARMTQLITSGRRNAKSQKPHAQLSENMAVVKLPRAAGETLLTLELLDGTWRVDDVMVDDKDKGERLPSLYHEALAVESCLNFLAAYERCDRKALLDLCSPDFYQGSLSLGNLKEVRLPSPFLTDHELKASLHGLRADFTLKNDREVVQVTLHRRQDDELEDSPRFYVTNVSVFDVATQQEMRLGAMFTARAMGEFYLQALSERDLSKLRHSSTRDFSDRVWKRLTEATVAAAPLEPFDGPPAEIGSIQFDGALVRVMALAGEHPVELLLREEAGRFLVDDIRWEWPGRPASAKATLELMIPVRNFAQAVARGRDPRQQESALADLQEASSRDFNRMVWTQTEFVPNSGLSADTFLNAPLKSLTQMDGQVIVQLGDAKFGAVVTMTKERERFAIDDVLLIAGPQPANRIAMKDELRKQLARGLAEPPSGIQQASSTSRSRQPPSRAVRADFAEPSPTPNQAEPPRELEEPPDAIPIENWDEVGGVQTEPEPN
jgi:hypothetical protein